MRTLFISIAPLLVMLGIGCNRVDPDECSVNISGGLGDANTIPTGAGVGATSSGDFITPPPKDPLAAGGKKNPCEAPEASNYASFSPSEFPFVTITQDDGTGPGGGWQEAKASLKFIKIRIPTGKTAWYCDFTIGMPLRTEAHGKISASRAASISIDVTEGAAVKMDYAIPQGFFCSAFVKGVTAAFQSKYPKLGEMVTK